MAQDISSIQRDLANLQKQSKQLSDKIKTETDPNKKAILQKKLIDLNVKKAELNKEIEAAVSSIGLGQELELEGFIKWNKYRKLKMTKNKLTEANDTDIDLSKPFAVIAVGGSIGDNKTNYIPKYRGKVYKTFDDVNDAKTYASRYRKMLSKGEKTYYGMSYKVVKLTPSDINSMQTESKLPKNKLTEAEKLKIKKFAKGLVESKNPEFEKMIKDFITSISKKHGYGFNDALQSLAYYLKKMYPEAFNG